MFRGILALVLEATAYQGTGCIPGGKCSDSGVGRLRYPVLQVLLEQDLGARNWEKAGVCLRIFVFDLDFEGSNGKADRVSNVTCGLFGEEGTFAV
jgi:hypothetical protein